MRNLVSLGFVCCLVGSACGGGGDDAVALAELDTEMGATMCAKMVECCTTAELEEELLGASNQQECEAFYAGFIGQLLIPVLEDSVAAGRLVYDGEQMRTCLDALAAIECADLRAALESGPAGSCEDPFTGQVAIGGMCANDVDCVTELCNGDQVDFEGNVTMGVCAQMPSNGQACVDNTCGAGLFCDYAGGSPTCQPELADGRAAAPTTTAPAARATGHPAARAERAARPRPVTASDRGPRYSSSSASSADAADFWRRPARSSTL